MAADIFILNIQEAQSGFVNIRTLFSSCLSQRQKGRARWDRSGDARSRTEVQNPSRFGYRLERLKMNKSLIAALALLAQLGWGQVRIHAGNWPSAYVDSTGASWSVDKNFTGGDGAYTGNAVAGTPDPIIYTTARYGLYGNFSYAIPVPNGTYNLTLKFAEIRLSAKGQRVFNVVVNGATVLSNFDVVAAAGAPFAAVDETFPITVTTGSVNIQFNGVVNLPIVSGIAIIPTGSTPVTPPPVTPPVTPTVPSSILTFLQNLMSTAFSGTANLPVVAGVFGTPGTTAAPVIPPVTPPVTPPPVNPPPVVTPPVTPPPTTNGAQWYTAPNGTPSGTGSVDSPWDLATTLAHPAAVHPGDTIWMRGGLYSAAPVAYNSSLTGTAAAPIILKQYPGERATVNGNIAINAPYTWYWGFEVTNTSGARSSGQPLWECLDAYPGSVGVKIINTILHDCDQGIGFWAGAIDAELNGNVIYNVGQAGATRGEGHAIYTQNQTGTKHILDNVIFDAFDINMQAYGSGAAFAQHYDVQGNISFNAGALYGNHVDNFLFAVGSGLDDISFLNNYTYHTPSTNLGYSRLGWEFGGSNVNGTLVANGNYFIGGQYALQMWGWRNASGTGNVFYSNAGLMLELDAVPATVNFDKNAYYGDGLNRLGSNNVGFSGWAASTGMDKNSTFSAGRPTGTWIIVRPNAYEAGRANIAIYNWPLAPTVSVDLSGVLKSGDAYSVRDVFNIFGAPLVSGTYSGAPVVIPMTGLTVTPPIGPVPVQPTHTAPEFGVFVVTRQ